MSRLEETIIEADKISYVLYRKQSEGLPSVIKKAFIDFWVDGKKYRLSVHVREKRLCKGG
jgi:hypothetical protein